MSIKFQTHGRILPLMSLLCLSALGGGCTGGGGSSDYGPVSGSTVVSPPAAVLVGTFHDGPTRGLVYRTSGNDTGATDASGKFTYVKGETISFYLGNLPLGSTSARDVITPIDLISGGHLNHDEVVNLSRFLQTLDEDGDPSNGISISEQARKAADSHFPKGVDYTGFFKTSGHANGFAKDPLFADESVATQALESFFKDAGIFRYKKSNWVEQSAIAGYLVPKSFAINHLRGTVQQRTDSWNLAVTPTTTSDVTSATTSTQTAPSQPSPITAPGSAAFTLYFDTTGTGTTSTTGTTNSFQYYDPTKTPKIDGKITFPGVTVTTKVTTTSSPTPTATTTSTTTTTATTSTTATTTAATTTTTTKNVSVTGDVGITFTGANVSMVSKMGTDGKNQGQLNISLLADPSTSTSGGTGTATFTPAATNTEKVTIPTSAVSSLVLKATVDLTTGTISDTKFSINLADPTWQGELNLGTVYGTWNREGDSSTLIFNELYRGLAAKATQKTWELYGVGYTSQEMIAELSGNVGSYTQLSTNRTNLKLLADSNTWPPRTDPYSLSGFIGFQIVIYDPSVRLDKLSRSDSASDVILDTKDFTFSDGKRYTSFETLNMVKKDAATLEKILSKEIKEGVTSPSTTTTSSTTAKTSQDGTETWGIADAKAGPGMVSVVFTRNSTLKSAGFTFQSALAANDTIVMKLVK